MFSRSFRGMRGASFPSWTELIAACTPYASSTGWRFKLADFTDPSSASESKQCAGPVVQEWGQRLRTAREGDMLMQELKLCQRLVGTEAVFNMMMTTCHALGLQDERFNPVPSSDDDAESCAYQDLSQPLGKIARCLRNYEKQLHATPGANDEHQSRLQEASFIVEFALEHGLASHADPTADSMLREFLVRVREWHGGDAEASEKTRDIVLGSVPDWPAAASLRKTALDWFDKHPVETAIGAVLAGGLVALAATGIAVAAAAARKP